jgi:RNA polymerase sigma factor for flagellar operon FliA
MVKYVANMIAPNASPDILLLVTREDHLSYGYMGLLDAINKFDPYLGIRFETYATKRIRGAILDGLRKEDPLTRRDRRDVKTLYSVYDQLWEEHGREPTRAELSERSGIGYDEVSITMQVAKTLTVSLDESPTGVDDDGGGGCSAAGPTTRATTPSWRPSSPT